MNTENNMNADVAQFVTTLNAILSRYHAAVAAVVDDALVNDGRSMTRLQPFYAFDPNQIEGRGHVSGDLVQMSVEVEVHRHGALRGRVDVSWASVGSVHPARAQRVATELALAVQFGNEIVAFFTANNLPVKS